jgi:hypothetical protein
MAPSGAASLNGPKAGSSRCSRRACHPVAGTGRARCHRTPHRSPRTSGAVRWSARRRSRRRHHRSRLRPRIHRQQPAALRDSSGSGRGDWSDRERRRTPALPRSK